MAKNKKNRDNNTAAKLVIISGSINVLNAIITLITVLIKLFSE